jgi:hypothetical protein
VVGWGEGEGGRSWACSAADRRRSGRREARRARGGGCLVVAGDDDGVRAALREVHLGPARPRAPIVRVEAGPVPARRAAPRSGREPLHGAARASCSARTWCATVVSNGRSGNSGLANV